MLVARRNTWHTVIMRFITKILGVILLATLLIGAIATPHRASAAGDVNNFTIQAFDADYYLSKDAQQRSQLKIVENITAIFPDYDQNHGIERAIPESYDGHNVRVHIDTVQNDAGQALPYQTEEANDNMVLRIGNADQYVHGPQIYRLTYEVHDATKDFGNHQELYWDVNGTQWEQTFQHVTARLHIPKTLVDQYDTQYRCFEGSQGATGGCLASQSADADGGILLAFQTAQPLGPAQTLTFVTAFKANTFTAYQPTAWERILPWLLLGWCGLNAVVLIVIIITLIRAWHRYATAPAGRGVIIPEYVVPKDISVLTGAVIAKRSRNAATAQIIDLAVRGYLKIYELPPKRFRRRPGFEIGLAKLPDTLRSEERELVRTLFAGNLEVGQRLSLGAVSTRIGRTLQIMLKEVRNSAVGDGFFEDRSRKRARYYMIGGLLMPLAFILILPVLFIGGIAFLIMAANMWPLSAQGVEKRDYLLGLKMYMQIAEKERIKRLQTPQGAEKVVDPNNHAALVKLYERLLPYAIIFGIDKEWAKEFAPLYEDQAPDWYAGNWTTFNAALFIGSFSSFTAASVSTFTPGTNSSSSGFSGGGGFAGGGGGGGGGGGW
jgi:uncharacterized membrane protein YgcG